MEEIEVARIEATIKGHKYTFSYTKVCSMFVRISCKENQKTAKRLEDEFNRKTHPKFPNFYNPKQFWQDALEFLYALVEKREDIKVIKGDFSSLARNDIACQ